jgi:hypothetical protein
MKSFSEFIKEDRKSATIAFCNCNPPTVFHEAFFDTVAKLAENKNYFIYTSSKKDSKYNILEYVNKVKTMRKMFPRHARSIINNESIADVNYALTELYNKGYTKINIVVPNDMEVIVNHQLNKYNGVDGNHGFYHFKEDFVTVTPASKRDPDNRNNSLKLTEAAMTNDFIGFSSMLPQSFKDSKVYFNEIRTAIGLDESHAFREHIQLPPVSDIREDYIAGKLYNKGELVVIKENSEIAKIVSLGANYVIIETNENKQIRKWLNDVEKLEN